MPVYACTLRGAVCKWLPPCQLSGSKRVGGWAVGFRWRGVSTNTICKTKTNPWTDHVDDEMAKIQSVMWKEKEGWTLERAYLAVKCQVQLCTSHILTDTDRIPLAICENRGGFSASEAKRTSTCNRTTLYPVIWSRGCFLIIPSPLFDQMLDLILILATIGVFSFTKATFGAHAFQLCASSSCDWHLFWYFWHWMM